MFAADNPFLPQARLAAQVLRIVAEEPILALKGGTAINFFYRDLPRLSVDLDLTYVPLEERETSLAAIEAALRRIAERIEARPHAMCVPMCRAPGSARSLLKRGAPRSPSR